MEPSKYLELSKTILETPEKRFCEIYKITNLTTNKIYIGQAVSHILNHKKYRPYGHLGRFKCHISEAFSTKKNQSHYLNNAIRKYGVCDFEVDLLEYCKYEDADDREIYYISMLSTTGGKLKVSPKKILKEYFQLKKYDKSKNIVIGFGITKKTIKSLRKADGLVVGSAICNESTKSIEKRQNTVTNVTKLVLSLKKKIK